MAKIVKPKNKQELDLMTKRQIEDFRVSYLSQSNFHEKDARRYCNELGLYIKIRFKDDVFAQYERWSKEAENPNSIDPQYREATVFTMGIIDRMGRENFYNLAIEQTKKELGEMQYIVL